MEKPFLSQIQSILASPEERPAKAQHLAEAIRLARGYRWVGLYDVGDEEIAVIGWSGAGAPTYPRFPVTQGLNGAAVSSRKTVIVNDVSADPRYLTTLGNTQSEMVVPVFHPVSQIVVGTIDVESVEKNAFSDPDQTFLEECATVIIKLWS